MQTTGALYNEWNTYTIESKYLQCYICSQAAIFVKVWNIAPRNSEYILVLIIFRGIESARTLSVFFLATVPIPNTISGYSWVRLAFWRSLWVFLTQLVGIPGSDWLSRGHYGWTCIGQTIGLSLEVSGKSVKIQILVRFLKIKIVVISLTLFYYRLRILVSCLNPSHKRFFHGQSWIQSLFCF